METNIQVDEKTMNFVQLLAEKFGSDGQNLSCHLEGLFHSRYQNYWDYTQLDILLNIQQPATNFPDEIIFITYHQITELYFKLILQELEEIGKQEQPDGAFLFHHLRRINRYMENLIQSFDISIDGIDKEQFLLFRTALSPASGFQSVQFRLIEIASTALQNLVANSFQQQEHTYGSMKELYECIYWKLGAMDITTGRKDMSLVNFEKKYDGMLLGKACDSAGINLAAQFERLDSSEEMLPVIIQSLRKFDHLFNVEWRLAHFRSAVKHLRAKNTFLKPTGGTNWKEYLPPRFQRIIFFPGLWSQEEKAEWGKSFFEEQLNA